MSFWQRVSQNFARIIGATSVCLALFVLLDIIPKNQVSNFFIGGTAVITGIACLFVKRFIIAGIWILVALIWLGY